MSAQRDTVRNTRASSARRDPYAIPFLVVAFVVVLVVSLAVGRFAVPLRGVVGALTSVGRPDAGLDPVIQTVVLSLRLPRALIASLAGAGLGLTGAALQGVFRNPLIGPQSIGVSAGAAFGGVLAILTSGAASALIGGAFLFGLLALILVIALGQLFGRGSIVMLVLAGVVVTGFFGALTALVEFLADPESQLPNIVFWLLGSFATARFDRLPLIAIPTLIGGGLLLAMRWQINVLSLGLDDAKALGFRVRRARWLVLGAVALVVSGQVAVSGVIGWIGLIVPHLARALVGPDHRHLLPASTLLGAVALLVVDTLARTISAAEIPLGVLTALVGTPFFALLIYRARARGWADD